MKTKDDRISKGSELKNGTRTTKMVTPPMHPGNLKNVLTKKNMYTEYRSAKLQDADTIRMLKELPVSVEERKKLLNAYKNSKTMIKGK